MRMIWFLLLIIMESTGLQAWAMGNYSEVLRDQYGRAIGGATVSVYNSGTSTLATIYSDNGVTAKSNPFLTDALDGRFNFYAENGVYDIVYVYPGATFDPAHTQRISVIDGSELSAGGGGGGSAAQGLEANHALVNEISGATISKPFIAGDGVRKIEIFGDATLGAVIRSVTPGDTAWNCRTNFNCLLRDEENAATMLTIDPDATSKNAMYQFGANYKPVGSVYVPLSARGAATITETNLLTNQPKRFWGQNGDNDTDAFDFHIPVTGKMDGLIALTVTLTGASTHATPSGSIAYTCAVKSYRPGIDTYAAHATAGEQTITLTPATQYRPVSATSPSIAINGTVAVGAELIGSCEANAAGTTSAQMTNWFLSADALVQFLVNSWSD